MLNVRSSIYENDAKGREAEITFIVLRVCTFIYVFMGSMLPVMLSVTNMKDSSQTLHTGLGSERRTFLP